MAGTTPREGKNPFVGRDADEQIEHYIAHPPQRIGPLAVTRFRQALRALQATRRNEKDWKDAYTGLFKAHEALRDQLRDLPED